MTKINILEMMVSCKLGSVYLGMSDADVILALGEPTDKGGTSRKNRWPTIWLYGRNIEIIFSPKEHRVVMMLINFWRDGFLLGEQPYTFYPEEVFGGMRIDEFIEFLSERDLEYAINRISEDTSEIVVKKCTKAIFKKKEVDVGDFELVKVICC